MNSRWFSMLARESYLERGRRVEPLTLWLDFKVRYTTYLARLYVASGRPVAPDRLVMAERLEAFAKEKGLEFDVKPWHLCEELARQGLAYDWRYDKERRAMVNDRRGIVNIAF